MNTRRAAQRWADTWQRSWNANHPEPIVALYAPEAVYTVSPFREPNMGHDGARAYLTEVLAEEGQVAARFGEPIVDGSRAAVQWWATFVEEGRDITLAGTSVLRFNDDGLVTDEWDAWEEIESHRSPPEGWGTATAE
jgi:predicted SnoaL-like aldol condensation-catalyzing enzyme